MNHLNRLYAALALCVAACSGGAEQLETQAPSVESGDENKTEPSSNEDADSEAPMAKSDTRVPSASAAAGTLAKSDSAGTDVTPATTGPTLTRVTLRFTDSSTPPEYHRSYTIDVEGGKATTKVDVYGDVIATDVTTVSESAWAKLQQSVPSTAPKRGQDDEEAGSSSYVLKIWQGTQEHDITWTSLTPTDPALKAAAAFAARIEALVPNLQKLKDTEYGASE